MAKSLFWLSDEVWTAPSPHLPRGRPGKPRGDDRTVISGTLHVLKTGCRWRDVPLILWAADNDLHPLPSLVLSAVSGAACSRRWRPLARFPTSSQSTAATSKRIARRAAQKGGV